MYSIVVNNALSSAKHCAATAAGLQNSVQISVSSLASAVVAAFASQAQPATGITIFVCMLALLLSYMVANGKPRSENIETDNTPLTSEE